ncbi:MAG TPA: hypothetical protein VGC65_11685 [Bacteroidia bacterium]|jgi:hypothetical protein
MKHPNVLPWASWVFCILIACVFAIKNLTQLDFFWMLRTGDWIMQNQAVPQTDILSYTFNGAEWTNVKWLYEVIIYFIADLGQPELIPVLQIIINLLVVFLIFKSATTLKKIAGEKNKIIPTAGIILATILFLLGTEYRMMGRPEIISHLMTLIFLFIYLSYKRSPSLLIYCLIPLQILWANCHDAFVNGCVITVVFLLVAFRNYIIQRKQKTIGYQFPKHLFIAGIVSLLSVGINPKGTQLYFYPFQLFSSLNNNTFSQEFLSALHKQYWMGKESYLLLIAFVICLSGFLFYYKGVDWKQRVATTFNTFGLDYFLLLLLFFYLALSAERNVVFFMIISAPFIAINIDRVLSKFSFSTAQKRKGYLLFCTGCLLFYISICNNSYYKALGIPYKYGLNIERNETPAATVQFIKEQGISGTCFSDYLTSSSLLWYLKPTFKSYIDLRDLEVFTPAFFDEYQQMIRDPGLFIRKDSMYHFDYAALYPGEAPTLQRYLYNSGDWVLVYLEPSCALYLKRNAKNSAILAKLDPTLNNSLFHSPLKYKTSASAKMISRLFWPFYKPEQIKNEDRQYATFTKDFYQMLGNDPAAKRILAEDHISMGRFEMQHQKWDAAMNHFENALTLKKEARTYLLLAECAGAMHAEQEKEEVFMEKWFDYTQKAYALEPTNSRIRLMLGLAFCMDKRDKVAGKKYLGGLEVFEGITQQEIALLKRCKEFCEIP